MEGVNSVTQYYHCHLETPRAQLAKLVPKIVSAFRQNRILPILLINEKVRSPNVSIRNFTFSGKLGG